jgi:hypothetical protein
MLLFLLVIGLILCLMVGTGIGKLRFETAKWLKRRRINGDLVELTPKSAHKLEKSISSKG